MIWNGKEGQIDMSEENIKNEYRFNIKFRRYVDRYCERRNVTVEEALGNESVRKACMRYTEV